jgi:hypothetical protein
LSSIGPERGTSHARTESESPCNRSRAAEASAPINKRQPLVILLFIILLVFVISSVVTASKKAAPLKSQLTARPATANPQQVNSFETQQEQVAKKDQEVQRQQAATAALLAAIQGADTPGPEAPGAPPMTPAQRAAIYGLRQSKRAAGNVADVGTAGARRSRPN